MSVALRRALALAVAVLLPVLVAAPTSAVPRDDVLAAPGVLVDAAVPAPPVVQAQSWLIADLDSGDVLAAQNASEQLAPASTLKILTALALAPGLDPAAQYTARPEDAAIDGSKVGIVPGSVYTVDDLLHGLMLGSGNDTASALAELSGGADEAVDAMQQKALELGATSTVASNPSGLDDPGQVSTARDLAVLGRAAVADPVVLRLATTKTYNFPGAGTTFDAARPRFQIGNHNKLLWNYPGTLGVKNGYTQASRTSFVGAAERDGHRYVVAMMRMEGSTWRQAASLLDWAFAYGGTAAPVASLDDVPEPDLAADDSNAAADDTRPTTDGTTGATERDTTVTTEMVYPIPAWLLATMVVLALLAMAVVVLRVRAVSRRRRRRRERAAAVSRTTSERRPVPTGPHRPRP